MLVDWLSLQAKADSIDSLERYRGKCEPCFLFYAVSMSHSHRNNFLFLTLQVMPNYMIFSPCLQFSLSWLMFCVTVGQRWISGVTVRTLDLR